MIAVDTASVLLLSCIASEGVVILHVCCDHPDPTYPAATEMDFAPFARCSNLQSPETAQQELSKSTSLGLAICATFATLVTLVLRVASQLGKHE
jgi:hypothetical protein